MSAPVYDVLLVVHVVVAVVGFGAIAVSGVVASSGRRAADPMADDSLRRYFRPGRSWPPRLVYLVPVFGLAMVLGGGRGDASHAWPWIGLAIWVVAIGLATGRCWPAERAAQAALGGEAAEAEAFRVACARLERGVIAVELCFLAALAVMILQPG